VTDQCKKPQQHRPGVPPGHDHPESSVTISGIRNQVYNVALGDRTTLNELFEIERALLTEHVPRVRECRPSYREFREGDVLHSQADISKARKLLGYAPTHRVREGLKEAMGWYIRNLSRPS